MSEQSFLLPPPDWKPATLGQVSECILGGTPSTEIPQFWNGDIPWMASGDVHIRRIRDVPGRITALGLRSSNATLTNPPTVAVGLAGQGKTRGTVALTLCTLSTNQSIALLKANGSDLRTDYLFHNLDRRYEELRARSSGGGRGGLSKAILEAVPIDLPPLSEQQKIAEILDTLDTAIHETEAIIAKLKAVKQGLLHDLLTRGIAANGELRPPQAEAPHLYKESPLGWIPKEWDAITLSECSLKIADRDHTTPRYTEDGVLIVSPTNLLDDEGIDFVSSKRISRRAHEINFKKTDLAPGDIILHRIGAGLGRVRLITAEMPEFSILHSMAQIRPNLNAMTSYFMLWVMRAESTKNQMGLGTQSIGVPDLGLDKISNFIVPKPPLAEQRQIAERLVALQMRIDTDSNDRAKLATLKTALMDDLLTGRVRVTPLLERTAP